MNTLDENLNRLVARARGGDESAFGKLVEQLQNRIFAVAYGVVGNRQDAEDIAQDTFLKAYSSIKKLKKEDSFYSWLVRIAINTSINYKKANNIARTVPIEGVPEPAFQGETPDSYIEKRGESEQIQEILANLPPESRAVLVLREVEGLGYEEIADMLGVPLGTVRSRIHYAREKLRRAVQMKEVK